jgi:peptidoglycan/xylan/chitin deacetylase (PgdA/CDA1 family)
LLAAGGGSKKKVRASTTGHLTTQARPTHTSSRPARLQLPARPPARTVSVPILMYHRIDFLRPSLPSLTRSLTVDPRDFAAQMRWLNSHGFHSITQLQLYNALFRGKPLPRRPVLITFDDGYRDVFGKASVVLHRLGLRATEYVITDRISGPDASFLTWPMLRSLERRGIEIGSHTLAHVNLTALSDAAALHELLASRRVLERRLGHPVQWFAYPYGKFDARIVGLVRRAGYVLAVTTRGGTAQSAAASLELHRYEVLDTTHVSGLAAMLAGAG